MLKIGVQSRGIINESVYEEGYKRIKASGIECIDYDIIREEEKELEVNYYARHRACADKYGLIFSQVHAPVIKYYDEYVFDNQVARDLEFIIKQLKKSIEITSLLGSPYLVVHALNIAKKKGEEEEFKINMQLFSSLALHAIKYNVIVCIENVPARNEKNIYEGACSSAQIIYEYVKKLNNLYNIECFGACFDVGHANLLKHNIGAEIKILGETLKVLHIHDNDGEKDLHQLPYVFMDGQSKVKKIDWNTFLIALRNINYRGVLSFETKNFFATTPGILQQEILGFLYKMGIVFSNVIMYEEILQKYTDHQIILFGAGKMFDVYMENFGERYKPDYVVDNNQGLWGTQKQGISIRSPQELSKNQSEKYVVIICSGFYEEIMIQLHEMDIMNYEFSEEIYRMSGRPD